MNKLWQQLRLASRGMWQHRLKALAVAWIVGAVGVAVAYRIPERYEASARLFVDADTVLKPLFAGLAIQPNVEQRMALVSRTLISRANIEQLVTMSGLEHEARTPAEREALIKDVAKALKLTAQRDSVYQITYRDADPQRAVRVVRSILDILIERTVGMRKQETQASIKLIDEQVKRFEDTLREKEGRLKEFKQKHGVALPSGVDNGGRLAEMSSRVEQARIEVTTAENTRDMYRRHLEEAIALSQRSPGGSPLAEIDTRIAQAKRELDALLLKFTDRHPDVVNARRLLAELQAERRSAPPPRKRSDSASTLDLAERNPVVQQLRFSLASAESAVSAARARLANAESQYQKMQARADAMPEIEAQYAELNRDYEVQRKTYENLLSRRDSAAMGADVQKADTSFRVIDPPSVSATPVAPNRFMLLLAAFGAALVAGLATAFAASELRPTFHDSRALRAASGRPTLGVISLLPTRSILNQRRRTATLFAGGVTGLVVSFAALCTFALLLARAGVGS